jgi:hypothetical protein
LGVEIAVWTVSRGAAIRAKPHRYAETLSYSGTADGSTGNGTITSDMLVSDTET